MIGGGVKYALLGSEEQVPIIRERILALALEKSKAFMKDLFVKLQSSADVSDVQFGPLKSDGVF